MCGDITVTRQLMRSYIDILNESQDTTNQTQLVENSSYRLTHEETDLFHNIVKISNFPYKSLTANDASLEKLVVYTRKLDIIIKIAIQIVNTAILDGERVARGGHENFFLQDEEITFMVIALCRELKQVGQDPRNDLIDDGKIDSRLDLLDFINTANEHLGTIHALSQQVYKAMQQRLQRETEVISERRKKKVNKILEGGGKKVVIHE